MTRYDNAQGFVIFNDGAPFQAMYRAPWSIHLLRDGFDNGVYWLLPVDGPMPAEMALFVHTVFARECMEGMVK